MLAAIAVSPIGVPASAAPPQPFLRLNGRLGRFTDAAAGTYDFTEASFFELPQASITTGTSWTPRSVFTGPRLLDVMEVAAVTTGTLIFKTLDDYSAPIPWDDLVRYGVILAHSQDGQRMSDRRWGPLWTIYPRDQHPVALKGPIAESRFIWQVNRIEVTD